MFTLLPSSFPWTPMMLFGSTEEAVLVHVMTTDMAHVDAVNTMAHCNAHIVRSTTTYIVITARKQQAGSHANRRQDLPSDRRALFRTHTWRCCLGCCQYWSLCSALPMWWWQGVFPITSLPLPWVLLSCQMGPPSLLCCGMVRVGRSVT